MPLAHFDDTCRRSRTRADSPHGALGGDQLAVVMGDEDQAHKLFLQAAPLGLLDEARWQKLVQAPSPDGLLRGSEFWDEAASFATPHNPAGERVWVHFKPGVSEADEWLAATLEPAYAVEELAAADWPLSLKATLYREARAVNGYTLEDAAKNS